MNRSRLLREKQLWAIGKRKSGTTQYPKVFKIPPDPVAGGDGMDPGRGGPHQLAVADPLWTRIKPQAISMLILPVKFFSPTSVRSKR